MYPQKKLFPVVRKKRIYIIQQKPNHLITVNVSSGYCGSTYGFTMDQNKPAGVFPRHKELSKKFNIYTLKIGTDNNHIDVSSEHSVVTIWKISLISMYPFKEVKGYLHMEKDILPSLLNISKAAQFYFKILFIKIQT